MTASLHPVHRSYVGQSVPSSLSWTPVRSRLTGLWMIALALGAIVVVLIRPTLIGHEEAFVLDEPPFAVAALVLAGFALWTGSLSARGFRSRLRVRQLRPSYPRQPWLWDFEWNAARSTDWTNPQNTLLVVLALPVIAIAAGFWRWAIRIGTSTAWLTFALVGGAAVLFLMLIVRRVWSAGLRRGSALWYDRFPLLLGRKERCVLRLTHAPLGRPSGILKCLEERYEVRATAAGRGRSGWSGYRLWETDVELIPDGVGGFVAEFEVPLDAPDSALSDATPRYWTLEVKSAGKIIGNFLVPLYRRPA